MSTQPTHGNSSLDPRNFIVRQFGPEPDGVDPEELDENAETDVADDEVWTPRLPADE